MIGIIYEQELSKILKEKAVYILSKENKEGYKTGQINEIFIEKNVTDFSKHFYVCGPDIMVQEILESLKK